MITRSRIFILSLLLLSFLPPSPSFAQTFPAVVLRVIDGDTVRVDLQGKEESVRLIGIDAPESRANAKAMRDSNRSGQGRKKERKGFVAVRRHYDHESAI